MHQDISIPHKNIQIQGHLSYPTGMPRAWIIFAHGSGSSRHSKRNNWVADQLNNDGFATLLFDLLTPEEDKFYPNRFDIALLSERLLTATRWLVNSPHYKGEQIGYFGASTGAAAALTACATRDDDLPIYAVVSRGGRPDLVKKEILNSLTVPTLLIVGSHDYLCIPPNEWAADETVYSQVVLVPGATHLFEEPGAMEEVVKLSSNWFSLHLGRGEKSDRAPLHR